MLGSSLRGNIALVVNIPADTWPVEIDVAEFELALLNVAVNARDAMPEGGTLSVAARNVGGVPGRTDGSAGRRLCRAHARRHRRRHPARRAAEDLRSVLHHQGGRQGHRAWAVAGLRLRAPIGRRGRRQERASGRGTTITMWLPRSRAAKSSKPDGAGTAGTASAGGTILVVEDNPEVADVTVTLLEQLGYRVLRAENAADALANVARRRDASISCSATSSCPAA